MGSRFEEPAPTSSEWQLGGGEPELGNPPPAAEAEHRNIKQRIGDWESPKSSKGRREGETLGEQESIQPNAFAEIRQQWVMRSSRPGRMGDPNVSSTSSNMAACSGVPSNPCVSVTAVSRALEEKPSKIC